MSRRLPSSLPLALAASVAMSVACGEASMSPEAPAASQPEGAHIMHGDTVDAVTLSAAITGEFGCGEGYFLARSVQFVCEESEGEEGERKGAWKETEKASGQSVAPRG